MKPAIKAMHFTIQFIKMSKGRALGGMIDATWATSIPY